MLSRQNTRILLTGQFARGWDISQGQAKISKILVRSIVHGSQVLPLLHRASKVDLVERKLELSGLIGAGESVVVVNSKDQSLVKGVTKVESTLKTCV